MENDTRITTEQKDKESKAELMDTGIYKKKYLPESWRFFIAGLEYVNDVLLRQTMQKIEETGAPEMTVADVLLEVREEVENFRAETATNLMDEFFGYLSEEDRNRFVNTVIEEGEYPEGVRPSWDSELVFAEA